MQSTNYPPAYPQPKKHPWLWVLLIVVILGFGGFLIWYYQEKTEQPVATTSPSPDASTELSSTESDLNKLDDNFNQLDKIDSSEDEVPSL